MKRSTLLVIGLLVVALALVANFGGLFQVGPFNTPACYYYKFTDPYNATFDISLKDQACTAKFGIAPYTYRWDFGDGKPGVQSTSPEVMHGYPLSVTNYNMVLLVFDSMMKPADYPSKPCGNRCPYTEVRGVSLPGQPGVVIGNAPDGSGGGGGGGGGGGSNNTTAITAGFTYSVVSGRTVSFDGGASNGVPPYTFHWDFGDGTLLNETNGNVTHTYQADGTYKATMVATDANNKSSAKTTGAAITFSNSVCTQNCGGTGTSGLSTVQIIQIALVAVGAVVGVVLLAMRRFRLSVLGAVIAALALLVPYLVK